MAVPEEFLEELVKDYFDQSINIGTIVILVIAIEDFKDIATNYK